MLSDMHDLLCIALIRSARHAFPFPNRASTNAKVVFVFILFRALFRAMMYALSGQNLRTSPAPARRSLRAVVTARSLHNNSGGDADKFHVTHRQVIRQQCALAAPRVLLTHSFPPPPATSWRFLGSRKQQALHRARQYYEVSMLLVSPVHIGCTRRAIRHASLRCAGITGPPALHPYRRHRPAA